MWLIFYARYSLRMKGSFILLHFNLPCEKKKQKARVKYEGENTEENETTNLMFHYFLFPGFFLSPVLCQIVFLAVSLFAFSVFKVWPNATFCLSLLRLGRGCILVTLATHQFSCVFLVKMPIQYIQTVPVSFKTVLRRTQIEPCGHEFIV